MEVPRIPELRRRSQAALGSRLDGLREVLAALREGEEMEDPRRRSRDRQRGRWRRDSFPGRTW